MKFLVKLLIVFLLLFIPMRVFQLEGEHYPEHVSFTGQDLSILPKPKNPLFVGVEGTILEKEDSTSRLLQFGEKVFLIRYEEGRARIMDRLGNIGYVLRSALSEEQTLGTIERPLEGVSYDANLDKPEAFRHFSGVRGIYVPFSKMQDIASILEEAKGSLINTLVLDYKVAGDIFFESKILQEEGIEPHAGALNPQEFLAPIKEAGFKTIAKIDVFRSPEFARANPQAAIYEAGEPLVFQELHWVSPYDRDHWRYIVGIAREALEAGFDEVQFDFVRFPVIDIEGLDYRNTRSETRAEAVQKFLYYAEESLRPYQRMLSANLYGRTSHYPDDEGVGMQFESISNAVDVVSPMIFPAYYGAGNLGVAYPEEEAYALVLANIKEAQLRSRNLRTPALIRPYLQAFSQSVNYDSSKIFDQIRALEDAGITDFLLYHDQGEYPLTELRRP